MGSFIALPLTHVGVAVPRPNLMRPLSINDTHATIINLLSINDIHATIINLLSINDMHATIINLPDARKQISGGEGNTEHTMTKGRLFNFLSTYHAQEQMLELMQSKMNGIAVKRKPFANTKRGRGIQNRQ